MGSGKKKNRGKDVNFIRGRLIFFEALLTIYSLITVLFAVLFEFGMVYDFGVSVMLSFKMSWQFMLFVAEFVTIIVQIISIALILKRNSDKAVKAVCIAGYLAGAAAVICVICLLFTQGFKVIPLVPFSVYAILICVVRMWMIPHVVKRK